MFADKFHSKKDHPPCFNTAEWCEGHVGRKFGEEKRQIFRGMIVELGLPDTQLLSKKYGHVVRGK